MTEKLYQQNVYLKSCDAVVTGIRDGRASFDRTVFFPEGGGQSSDVGTITLAGGETLPVTLVREEDGGIWHSFQDGSGSGAALSEGARVHLEIDWDHRFENMQRHAGEHILSGAFYRLFGGANKGFHMGEESMTIDIALPEDSPHKKISWSMAMDAERDANRVIWRDEPITVDYFARREEAEAMPLRKALAFDEDISIVTVGPKDHPSDCVACCGTHPSSSGQVGLIKIYKVESNKGMTRVFFEAGSRALARAESDYDMLYDLSLRLSTGTDDVLEKYDIQQKRNRDLHDELNRLKKAQAGSEASAILASETYGLIRRYSGGTIDDLLDISKRLNGKLSTLVVLVHEPTHTCLLLSPGTKDGGDPSLHCGDLVKSLAKEAGGKGGGSDHSARAIFPDSGSMEQFLKSLQV